MEVRNLQANCHVIDVDSQGTLTANGMGLHQGNGVGKVQSGGSYGGRGGQGAGSTGVCLLKIIHSPMYLIQNAEFLNSVVQLTKENIC